MKLRNLHQQSVASEFMKGLFPMHTETITNQLFNFIDNSPTAFHAIANAAGILEAAGYQKIVRESDVEVKPGGKYYLTRNDTSVIAFRLPE